VGAGDGVGRGDIEGVGNDSGDAVAAGFGICSAAAGGAAHPANSKTAAAVSSKALFIRIFAPHLCIIRTFEA
jgi:hypothetical protein